MEDEGAVGGKGIFIAGKS